MPFLILPILMMLFLGACTNPPNSEKTPVATVDAIKAPTPDRLKRFGLQTLLELVKIYPENTDVHLALAESLRFRGRFEDAAYHYQRVLDYDLLNDVARVGRAFSLIRIGKFAEARAALEDDLKLFPGEPTFRHLYVRVLVTADDESVRDGKLAGTLVQSLAALGVDPSLTETIAMVWAEVGEFEKAVSAQQGLINFTRERDLPMPPHMIANLQLYVEQKPCRKPWPDDSPVFTRRSYTDPISPSLKKNEPWMASGLTMIRRLELINENNDPETNIYLNDLRAKSLASSLNQSDTPDPALMSQYAAELVRSGQSAEAIKQLELIEKIVRDTGVKLEGKRLQWLLNYQALAWMRLGEQENCILNHSAESCLLPIQKGGLHQAEKGSRGAIKYLTEILNHFPEDLNSRWLLNIAYQTLGEYPEKVPSKWLVPPAVFESEVDFPRFPEVSGALGLDHDSLAGASVLEDFNNDGLLDLFVTDWDSNGKVRFWRNAGDGTFSDLTTVSGLHRLVGGLNAVTADFNNDGYVDIFVLRGAWLDFRGEHPNSLLRNNGDGSFSDITEQAGLLRFRPTQTATWFDYNNDGHIDLFVGNETLVDPNPCELYRNNGDGTFTEIAELAGVAHLAFVKAAVSGDIDNDGLTDLFLSVLDAPNVLYRNLGAQPDGSWKFEDITDSAGVGLPVNSFPAWFFDYDNDGFLDLFVSDYNNIDTDSAPADLMGFPFKGDHTRLYRNKGDGTFEDRSRQTGIDRVYLTMGCNFGDLDNDGWLDFYLATGKPNMSQLIPNRMYRNNGGKVFEDVTWIGGFGHLQKGHAVSFGDIDNDGDQDVHVVMGGAYSGDNYRNALFKNPGQDHDWIKIKLQGKQTNRAAIGARVAINVTNAQGNQTFHRVVTSGSSFGVNPLRLEVGLGLQARINSVEIFWPGSGNTQKLNLTKNKSWLVDEDGAVIEQELTSFSIKTVSGNHHH